MTRGGYYQQSPYNYIGKYFSLTNVLPSRQLFYHCAKMNPREKALFPERCKISFKMRRQVPENEVKILKYVPFAKIRTRKALSP